jgi:flagellar protein FlgJ
MNPPAVHTDFYADFHALGEVRGRAAGNSEETLREVAGQFEALFIQMMLKSMRDANLGEGLLDSQHTKTYQSMFDQQIALDLSKRQGLGLAEMMVRQLSGNEMAGGSTTEPRSPEHRVLLSRTAQAPQVDPQQRTGDGPGRTSWQAASPQDFVKTLWPHAQMAAKALSTRPELLISQAALETGWGKHMIVGSDGRESLNLFGIKADARWKGERVITETVEFRDGLMRKERASFRAYSSLADSFADYADFLKSNPRYSAVMEAAADVPAFARELDRAGYATDPEYGNKISSIMNGETLREALQRVKEDPPEPLTRL